MTNREKLIKAAYDHLAANGNGLVETKTTAAGVHRFISKTTKGYIASLGGSIVQAGLKQSVIFFEATKEGREDVIKAIFAMLKVHKEQIYRNYPVSNIGTYLTENAGRWDRQSVTKDVVEAAVALKMAMRLYPHQ